jgi:GTP-binding protein
MKNYKTNTSIRNIAIIAHVDHGKTTLVDQLFKQSGLFRENQNVDDRLMDRMDLERERGITISAKNCSVKWDDIRINILDTPGHADFGGEVERALRMVNGVVLLVDAAEGPLPQTRFVLQKALNDGKKVIVVINKIDRQDERSEEVLNEIYDLFIELDATEEQIEFPVLYAIGKEGKVGETKENLEDNLKILFDLIIREIPPPQYEEGVNFQMQVLDLDYSDYMGRLAVGPVVNGEVKKGDALVRIGEDGVPRNLKVSSIQLYEGLTVRETDYASAGDIIILSGIDDVHIGDTICQKDFPEALVRITVDEPTISMTFTVNTSPFAGQEGKIVQGNKIKDRLIKETLQNVGIKVELDSSRDTFIVKGRGEFQMAILVETMRREGFELSVGRPTVVYKYENDKKLEPIEHLFVDCGEDFVGVVTEKLSRKKGRLTNMVNHGSGRVRLEFSVPSRSLIGYRNEFLTDTKGTGIMNSYLEGYEEHRGDFPARLSGSLVADRMGKAAGYALFNLEPRGVLFVIPTEKVYEGMIVGEHNRENDLDVNATKEKKLSNMRASGKDESINLAPVTPMTLEKAIEFIKEDEQVEVTPKSVRLRKRILQSNMRYVEKKKGKQF